MAFWSKWFKGSESAGKSPQQIFAADVERVLRATPGVADLVYDEAAFAFSVTQDNGSTHVVYLGNVFASVVAVSSRGFRD